MLTQIQLLASSYIIKSLLRRKNKIQLHQRYKLYYIKCISKLRIQHERNVILLYNGVIFTSHIYFNLNKRI